MDIQNWFQNWVKDDDKNLGKAKRAHKLPDLDCGEGAKEKAFFLLRKCFAETP